MSVPARTNRLVGAALRRKEDPRFLRGRGSYVDDLRRPGMVHAAFFRSDIAHGLLKSVDVADALKVPGVLGVFTGREIGPMLQPLIARNSRPSYHEFEVPMLPRDKVVYVGQPIAIVVAETRHEAEDGVDAIRAEIEALPPVLDLKQATQPGAPNVHPAVPGNAYNHFSLVQGDVEKAFAQADFVIDWEFSHARCAAVPLEGRVTLAEWDAMMQEVSVFTSNQAPHLFRTGLAEVFGLKESSVRVVAPDVGGGFGVKLGVYPEECGRCRGAAYRSAGEMDVRPARGPAHDAAGPRADPSHPHRGAQRRAHAGRARRDPRQQRRLRDVAVHRRARFRPGIGERHRPLRHRCL